MGREEEWTSTPPPPGGVGPVHSSSEFAGAPQVFGMSRGPGANASAPSQPWGVSGGNANIGPGFSNPYLPPAGQPMHGGQNFPTQQFSGPSFRPATGSGVHSEGPPVVRGPVPSSGIGRGTGPPGIRPPQPSGGFGGYPPGVAPRGSFPAPPGPPAPPGSYVGAQSGPPGAFSSKPPFPSGIHPPGPQSLPQASWTIASQRPPGPPSSFAPNETTSVPRVPPHFPPTGSMPGPTVGPPGYVPRPNQNQPLGPVPPVQGTRAPYNQGSIPPSTQFQSMSLGNQNQAGGGLPPPPMFGAPNQPPQAETGAPPSWQGAARRIYPDAYAGPPPGSATPMMGAQSQPTSMIPPNLPPPMGHLPGVVEKYAPGISQPGSPATGAPQSGTSRIDPNQIPRPQPSSPSVEFETRVNGQANLPPSATSNFRVKDTGNCSPRMMRCTLNQIPCSGDLLGTSGMPLAVMVQPFALPHPDEESIEVVDFGETGPVRCSRCKGYINPFMKFIDQGRRFMCNLCGFSNDTPRDYHCNLGPDGRRRDCEQRPELCRGSVEFVASKEYLVRPPMPQVFFFLLDVSMNAVQTGAVAAACSAINRALADLPEGPHTKVGIATFDSTIHFYSLNKVLQQPAMLVVPDIQDVYTPLQSDLIVPLVESREHLEQLLESIPTMFQNNRIAESGLAAAIKGAYLAMKLTGGKLLAFQSVLPTVGVGALTPREGEGRAAGEKEGQKLLQPADKILRTMAIELAEFQVCVDLFLMSQLFVDIASLSVVPRTTGGQVYFYHPFYAGADSAKLYNDLRWSVTRPQGLEAVMRVRCSQGLQVQDYYGNFCKRIPTDVDLPAIDSDKTIMVTFKHDDKFQDGAECCFQCALLYTTVDGQRRIRVNTLSLSCTTVLSNLFRGADLDAQFTYFLKHAAQEVPNVPLAQVKEQITGQCVNILYTYRKFCATASSPGQLILPEALKLLPLYTLALTKSVGLRTDTRVDERSNWLTRVASLSASLSIPLVYPRMFAVHNIPSKEEIHGILPQVVPLSSENLDHDGIFLLETGEDAFLYVGKQAPTDVLHRLFGVQSVDEVPTGQFVLQEYDNDLSRRLNEVVNEIRRQRCSYLRLRLLRRGDPLEFIFFSFLVEDKSSSGLSYVEFLVHVHRQIQNKMT